MCTENGSINIHEIKQFSNLNLDELTTLRAIYFNRLNQINKEIRKRNSEEDAKQMCMDMMSRYGHCTFTMKIDCEYIINKFKDSTDWKTTHSRTTSETLSLATLAVIYDKYNIEYNMYELSDLYDLNSTKVKLLYLRLRDWTNINYWKN